MACGRHQGAFAQISFSVGIFPLVIGHRPPFCGVRLPMGPAGCRRPRPCHFVQAALGRLARLATMRRQGLRARIFAGSPSMNSSPPKARAPLARIPVESPPRRPTNTRKRSARKRWRRKVTDAERRRRDASLRILFVCQSVFRLLFQPFDWEGLGSAPLHRIFSAVLNR